MTTLREELEQVKRGDAVSATLASRLATTFNELSDFIEKLRIEPRRATNYLSRAIEEVSARLSPKQTDPEIRQAILDELTKHIITVVENQWEICSQETKSWFISLLKDDYDRAKGRYDYYSRVMGLVKELTYTADEQPIAADSGEYKGFLNRTDCILSDNHFCPKCQAWGIETLFAERIESGKPGTRNFRAFMHPSKNLSGNGYIHRIQRLTKEEYDKLMAMAKFDKRAIEFRHGRLTPEQYEREVEGKSETEVSELARTNPPPRFVRGAITGHPYTPQTQELQIEEEVTEEPAEEPEPEPAPIEQAFTPEPKKEQHHYEPNPDKTPQPTDLKEYRKDLDNMNKAIYTSLKPQSEEKQPPKVIDDCERCHLPGIEVYQKVTERNAEITFWRHIIHHPKTTHKSAPHRCYLSKIGTRKATSAEMSAGKSYAERIGKKGQKRKVVATA